MMKRKEIREKLDKLIERVGDPGAMGSLEKAMNK